jgi:glycosyltransferase involved in cell wall biosynthesis
MEDGNGMKILMLNYPYLKEELRELGHRVICAGMSAECNIVLPPDRYDIHNILSMMPLEPEVIIFMDSVERGLPYGLEECQIPFAAVFIDAPINRFWQFPLAEMAGSAMFDQKTEAAMLARKGLNSLWFPLAADGRIYKTRGLVKEFDIVFVGGRNPSTRGKRENILKALSANYNLRIFDGNPRLDAEQTSEVYNRSRLVLNENLFPSLNLRLFEAMACGSAVLTENDALGLCDIFIEYKNPWKLLENSSTEARGEAPSEAGNGNFPKWLPN